MKIGIIGLAQTGKKTLFELLTHHRPSEKELVLNKPIKGVAEIKDPRFDKLVNMYSPKKATRAKFDIEVLPKLEKDAFSKGDIFKDIADADALCHIVRAFKDESVYHVDGTVDPKRDIETVNSELIFNDIMFVEKRLERVELALKKSKDDAALKEKDLLLKIKSNLDKNLPLRVLSLTIEEKKLIVSYPFITGKEMIIVLNVSEDDLANKSLIDELKAFYKPLRIEFIAISAKVEAEIAKFESESDKRDFMGSLGIKEPAVDALTLACIKALNLMYFFTVGPDEVRQWIVKSGSLAPDAAGAIHTDLKKGFIRAEVIKYNDLINYGSEDKVKEAGKTYLKGKDYVVEDGDILNIRFNV